MNITVTATCTQIRQDGMQKWERTELPETDSRRYIWLAPFGSIRPAIGDIRTLEFTRGTGGPIGGHWAGWRIVG